MHWAEGQVFFFKGSDYVSFDLSTGQTDEGYPRPIATGWAGLGDVGFADSIDAAVNWDDGTIFLFKGDQYVKYDTGEDRLADGDYPRTIDPSWPGLEDKGFADGLDAIWLKLTVSGGRTPTPAGAGREGDHIWYWNANVSTDLGIPRTTWFPGSTDETDYQGHGREIFEYVVYADHIKAGQPHMLGGPGTFAWLNNNPGNLTAGGQSVGEFPGKRNWHNFLIFPTRQAGFDAIPLFLRANGYGPLSIRAAIARYAPSGDGTNSPEHYAQSIVNALGGAVTMDTRIDELTPDQMLEVQRAIEKMEGTVEGDTPALDDARLPAEVSALL